VRIGIIATEFPPDVGGMQVMALRLATHLAKSHEVLVCCTARTPRETYLGFQVLANLRGRTEADVAALRGVDARVDVWLAMNAGYSAIASKLRKPLIVYFHGNDFLNPWVISAPLLLKLLSKFPLIGKTWYDKRRAFTKRQIGTGLLSTAKILTNSNHTKALIQEQYPHCQMVFVCPPGVEERFFENALTDQESSILNLLTVCRLQKGSRRKNVAGVLHALASLRDKLKFTYAIVGDGDDLENLKSLRDKLGLAEQVIFLGRVSDRDLLELYRCASLFVLPAQSSALDVEGFGIVYLEANAAGVPVLCSAAGGATDAVIDGQTGIILPSSEPERIAQGILHFVQFRSTYNRNRLRQFASNFKWAIRAAEIESQILSVLQSLDVKPQAIVGDPTATLQKATKVYTSLKVAMRN